MSIDTLAGIAIVLVILMMVGMFVGFGIFAYKVGKENDEFWEEYNATKTKHNSITRRDN